MKREELFEYWRHRVEKTPYYHGTNSVSYELIGQEGLVPGNTPFDKEDIARLDHLVLKSKYYRGFGPSYKKRKLDNNPGFFLSIDRDTSVMYSKSSPEFWSELVTWSAWERRDKECAIYNVCKKLIFGVNLLNRNFNNVVDKVYQASNLKKEEVDEFFGLLDKYWELLEDSKPILLTISPVSKALRNRHNPDLPFALRHFEAFLYEIGFFEGKKTTEELTANAEGVFKKEEGMYRDIKITEPIPVEDITRVELV